MLNKGRTSRQLEGCTARRLRGGRPQIKCYSREVDCGGTRPSLAVKEIPTLLKLRRYMKRILLLCLVMSLCVCSWAQTLGKQDISPIDFGSTDSHQYDSVDLMTNNVHLEVPIMTKNGFIPFNLSIVGDSAMPYGATSLAPNMGTAGLGMYGRYRSAAISLTAATVSSPGVFYTSTTTTTCSGASATRYWNWFIETGTGEKHPLTGGTAAFIQTGTGAGCNTTQTWTTGDNSGYVVTAGFSPDFTLTIADSSGVVYSGGGTAQATTDVFQQDQDRSRFVCNQQLRRH